MFWIAVRDIYEKWINHATKRKHYRAIFYKDGERRISKTKFNRASDVAPFVRRYNERCPQGE